ncbi:MAG TPA: divalent-cation tolerance protein CutA [Nitrospirota bacterium]|nr:divalent-cation tolerance protein CutA [Nitrospirota bacterium]
MAEEIIVLITVTSKDEAGRIGTALVNEHIAACVNILPQIRSLFFWDGKTQDENEMLMIVKSRLSQLDRIIARVKELHSYTVPEVIAIPIIGGSPEYLHWLKDSTQG